MYNYRYNEIEKVYRPDWADLQELGCINYKIGDVCEIQETNKNYNYWGDWVRTDLHVVGIYWAHRQNKWEVLVRHDGDQFTEFALEDLWKKVV